MMRKTISLAAAALALAVVPPAAQAQSSAAKPAAKPSATDQAVAAGAAPKMTPEQLENFQRGIRIMRTFTAAFTSEQVTTEVKGRLISCLYANTLAKISAATGQVLKGSPTLDASKPTDLYRAAAGVCGIVFKKVDAADKPATTPAATGDKAKTTGR